MDKRKLFLSCGILAVAGSFSAQARAATNEDEARAACRRLESTKIASAVVKTSFVATSQEFVAAYSEIGHTPPPEASVKAAVFPFCRVQVTVTPAPNADIKLEVWLPPRDKWNERYLGVGNGGAAGSINPDPLVSGVGGRYAVMYSDAGSHAPNMMDFRPVRQREWQINYAHRGYHLATVAAKQLVASFYGNQPKNSLFIGCSGGGYEALAEVQRYPKDYRGVIVGDPAIYFTNIGLWQGMSYVTTHKDPASLIPPTKLPAIHAAVMRQCDGVDGLVDGVIDDPRQCKVDFRAIQCTGRDEAGCLTSSEIAALTRLYRPLNNPRTHALIYPGFPYGAEDTPAAHTRISGEAIGSTIKPDSPGILVWILPETFVAKDWFKFDFDVDATKALQAMRPFENDNPDISEFTRNGGKLIIFTGQADPNLFPQAIINYYDQVRQTLGSAQADKSVRLFMVPGMNHCTGGPGANNFGQTIVLPGGPLAANYGQTYDAPLGARGAETVAVPSPDNNVLLALDRWVLEKRAPERIVAAKYTDDNRRKGVEFTRPLCAYPEVARWNRKDSSKDARNFSCVKS